MADIDVEITPGSPGGPPAAAAFSGADLFLMVQGGDFVAGLGSQLLTFVNANIDATLVALAGVTVAANKGVYATGADAFSTYDLTAGGRALGGVAGTADTFPYFSASNVVTLGSITAAGRALLDDADASAQRTTLGLGSLATLSSVSNTNWSGTDLSIANGGTGASTDSAARTALGVAIGSDVQAWSANLDEYAAVNPTAAGLALLDDADAAAQRTTLNVDSSRLDLTLAPVFFDDFLFASTESGEIGELGWGFTNGTWGLTNAVANHPGVASRVSTAVTGTVASTFTGGGGSTVSILGSQIDEQQWVIWLQTAHTDADYRFGFLSDLTANPPTHGAYFEKLAADTNWFGVNRLSAAQTRSDLGVAAAHSNWFKLKVRRVDATTMAYSINGGSETTIATNSPNGVSLAFGFHIVPTNSAARTVYVDAFAMRLQPNAR